MILLGFRYSPLPNQALLPPTADEGGAVIVARIKVAQARGKLRLAGLIVAQLFEFDQQNGGGVITAGGAGLQQGFDLLSGFGFALRQGFRFGFILAALLGGLAAQKGRFLFIGSSK
jgi:hypothetical protein